jgi:hypothetical protein
VTAAPVVIRPSLPAEIVVLAPAVLEQIRDLTADAAGMLTDPAGYTAEALEQGNAAFRRLDGMRKDIEAGRLALTRPIDTLKAQIIEAERQGTTPLAEAKDALGRRIAACHGELRRRHEEEQRRIREEAERQAAEARRLEAERQATERKAREEAEAKRREAAALFGSDEEEPAAEPAPATRPVIPAPAAVMAPPPPPPPSAAVRVQKRQVLCITDRAALMAAACKDGGALYGRPVLTVDEEAVLALLKAGVAVPGARLDEVEAIAANRGRK